MSGAPSPTATSPAGSGPATAAASSITQTGTSAVSSLTGNFNNFLTMLMTQLKSQDPTQPLDSTQFISELVQFSSVEQQIATNNNLTQLIQLTQASQIEQSSSMLGKHATVNSAELSLQNGSSQINFTTKTSETVAIAVYNAGGTQLQTGTFKTNAGVNVWQWNGKAANGVTLPDGAYKVTVNSIGSNGSTSAIPFTVTGTVTSVQSQNGSVQLQMGGLTVPFNSVQSVGG